MPIIRRFFFCLAMPLLMSTTVPTLLQAANDATLTGTVLETMSAADYTYLKLKTSEGPVWIAMPATKIETGQTVSCADGMVMYNFDSKTLGRTFAEIVFSTGLAEAAETGTPDEVEKQSTGSSFTDAVKQESMQQPAPETPMQASTGSMGATVPFTEEKVAKAEGENSYTVEEIFAQAGQLTGKTVRLRGKVVKINPNIMGKNWIHIQDGTGNPMHNSHDLVVTSSNVPELNEIVVIDGKVAANKDFGYGYKYDVLIEEATFQK